VLDGVALFVRVVIKVLHPVGIELRVEICHGRVCIVTVVLVLMLMLVLAVVVKEVVVDVRFGHWGGRGWV